MREIQLKISKTKVLFFCFFLNFIIVIDQHKKCFVTFQWPSKIEEYSLQKSKWDTPEVV